MKIDWEEAVTTSYLGTVETIRQLMEEEDYEEAQHGLDQLYETMANRERRALHSQLVRLMAHILKWNLQPAKRSTSWVRSILDARREIGYLQRDMPSLSGKYILTIWEECFADALKEAKAEMGYGLRDVLEVPKLTWQQVFEDECLLPRN
jgi:hypothetical protein